MKFIYWFAFYDCRSPSVRYRAKYPLESLRRQRGIDHLLVVPGYSPGRVLRFLFAYFSVLLFRKKDSIIVVQRVRSGFIYANALKLLVKVRRKGTIYDLDDGDYLEHAPGTIYYFAAKCERVSAGSQAIMEHLRTFNPRIGYVTSPVIDLGILKKGRSPVFTVGWVGDFSGGHREGLTRQLFPALKRLDFDLRLVLIGVRNPADAGWIADQFASSPNVELDLPTVRSWLDERWLQKRITGFDVGIATLIDTPIQRAKSGIKAKQYLNNGVPVLSTDLRENNTVVVHGVNGYLFNSVDEVVERLSELRSMSENDYARISANARASITRFDHALYFKDLNDLITVPPPAPLSDTAPSHTASCTDRR